MKNIFEVLQEKEEQLRVKKQEIKLLEEQVVKLRGAIEIFNDVMKGEDTAAPAASSNVLSANDDPLNLNTRAAAAPAAPPTRNWP